VDRTACKGAQELFDAYRAFRLTAEDMKGGRYFRINHIQRLLDTGKLGSSLRWEEARRGNILHADDPGYPAGSAH
jgi:hypothetical protein